MARVQKRYLTENLSQHFPDDVLIDIFLKLRVRSLFLFRSVCKHWLRLIQSPNFIHLHLNRPTSSQNDHNPLLIIHAVYTEYHPQTKLPKFGSKTKFVLTLMSGAYKDDMSLESLSPSTGYKDLWCEEVHLHLLGPCNGLLCITDMIDIVMVNPVTRQCRQVPHSPLSSQGKVLRHDNLINYFDRFCFGFDGVSNDYKVVGFHRKIDPQEFNGHHYDEDGYCSDSSDRCYGVEIFRLSTNSWTRVDRVGPLTDMCSLYNKDWFLNGACNWLGCDNSTDIYSIVVFDLNKEAFKQFEIPDCLTTEWHLHLQLDLSVMDDYLTLFVRICNGIVVDEHDIEMWVMKEYGVYSSWTKLYKIHAGATGNICKPLSFSREGEIIFVDKDRHLVSFNFNTRVIKKLGNFMVPEYALEFRESLVSPWRSW